jgi:hypothetical protein
MCNILFFLIQGAGPVWQCRRRQAPDSRLVSCASPNPCGYILAQKEHVGRGSPPTGAAIFVPSQECLANPTAWAITLWFRRVRGLMAFFPYDVFCSWMANEPGGMAKGQGRGPSARVVSRRAHRGHRVLDSHPRVADSNRAAIPPVRDLCALGRGALGLNCPRLSLAAVGTSI